MKSKSFCLFMGLITIFLVSFKSTEKDYKLTSRYPTYEQVVTKFFNLYSIARKFEDAFVYFEKRNTGWHVVIKDLSLEQNVIAEYLFWDLNSKKYKKLDLDEIESIEMNEAEISYYLDDQNSVYNFNILPYYGYVGWEEDIINEFGNANELPDTLLFALGYAYSNYARNILLPTNLYSGKESNFNLQNSGYKMSYDQLQEYKKYSKRATELFDLLAMRNPEFYTLVGPIGIRASNEYVTSFYDIYIFKSYEDAKSELKPGLYDDFFIAMAKNHLSSCSQNAILFTFGDNDTYPILYVQNQLNFRTDVLVVCLPFFASDWYIDFLRNEINNSEKFPLQLEKNKYQFHSRDVLYYVPSESGEEEGYISIDSLLNYITDDVASSFYYEGELTYSYNRNKIYINVDSAKVVSNGTVKPKDADKIEKVIEFDLDRKYLIKNEMMILDLIRTNNWERPICFTSIGDSKNLGLDDYFQNDGFVYRLVPIKSNTKGRIDTEDLYNFIMNELYWFDIGQTKNYYRKIVARTLSILRIRATITDLVIELVNEGEMDKAKKVIEKCEKLLPTDIITPGIFDINYADALYAIGNESMGDEYLTKIIETSVNDLDELFAMKETEMINHEYDIQLSMETIRRVLINAQTNKRDELYSQFDNLFNIYMNKYLEFFPY